MTWEVDDLLVFISNLQMRLYALKGVIYDSYMSPILDTVANFRNYIIFLFLITTWQVMSCMHWKYLSTDNCNFQSAYILRFYVLGVIMFLVYLGWGLIKMSLILMYYPIVWIYDTTRFGYRQCNRALLCKFKPE